MYTNNFPYFYERKLCEEEAKAESLKKSSAFCLWRLESIKNENLSRWGKIAASQRHGPGPTVQLFVG